MAKPQEFDAPIASDESLKTVSILATRQLNLESEIERVQKRMDELTDQYRRLTTEDLPTAMEELGLTSFVLTSGETVTVKSVLRASITKERRPDAHRWLVEHGHGDLIKRKTEVKFGRGEEKNANELRDFCEKHGFVWTEDESVHPQTLGAFVREQMSKGVVVPMDMFGIIETKETKISSPKK